MNTEAKCCSHLTPEQQLGVLAICDCFIPQRKSSLASCKHWLWLVSNLKSQHFIYIKMEQFVVKTLFFFFLFFESRTSLVAWNSACPRGWLQTQSSPPAATSQVLGKSPCPEFMWDSPIFIIALLSSPHVIEEMLRHPALVLAHRDDSGNLSPPQFCVTALFVPVAEDGSTEKLVICSVSSGDSVPTFVMSLGLGTESKGVDLSRVTADSFDQLERNLSSWKIEVEEEISFWCSWNVCGIWDVEPGWPKAGKERKRRIWVLSLSQLAFLCLLFLPVLWPSLVEVVGSFCRMGKEVVLSFCAVISDGLIIFLVPYSALEGAEETSWLLAEHLKALP